MDPQHHDTAEYIAEEGNDFRIQLDSADRRFQSGQPSVSSYSVLQRLLPQLSVLWPLGNSASAVGDLGLFEEEAAVVPEYRPIGIRSPAIFVFTHLALPAPAAANSALGRRSISQSPGSPRMNVAQAFDNMTFRSPELGTDPLRATAPPSPAIRNLPPRLMTAPIINAPEGDGLGPRLHIVPATPVSGGGAASAANSPCTSRAPRSSSDHDPPQWDNTNFIGQMGNIGSALDDEAPRARVRRSTPSTSADHNGFLSPDLRRSRSASEHHPPGPHEADPLRGHAVSPPGGFFWPAVLEAPSTPPPSIRARGPLPQPLQRRGSARSWSNRVLPRAPRRTPPRTPPPLRSRQFPLPDNINAPTVSKQNVTTSAPKRPRTTGASRRRPSCAPSPAAGRRSRGASI
ncbi:hypothetical protein R3P38DRAFT_3214140 [Favolaschia claudopus]|uniref:Uncharacterized protein n=1 Tax=Favolaschia claudopus TaxID=2862362 RepID=A0AAW0AA79_9AGAR